MNWIKSLLLFLWISPMSLVAQTFSVTVNQSIPDDNTLVTFDINVTGLPTTINATFGLEQVCFNMTHTYDSDMELKLKSPDGHEAMLFSGIGGGNDNFTNTCLAGVGASISAASAPFSGTFQGMSVLGNLNNGQNPNGTWQLVCRDMAPVDIGFLTNWGLTFSSTPAQPFIFLSSNLPIVKLTTLTNSINNQTKVPVLMQIIDHGTGLNFANDTAYVYEGQIMTEWQGFTGPLYPKKNYDFDLIDPQGNKIDTNLLGMPSENDWILKAEYLDHSLMKNTIAYEFARRMGNYAPRIRPCEVILDGEYIGYYSLTEKVKRDKNRLDIANLSVNDISGSNLTGGYIIEMNINGDPAAWNSVYPPINNATCGNPVEFKVLDPKPSVISPVQTQYIKNYVDSFENVLQGPMYLDAQNGYRNWIDVSSFIDFLIVNEFSVNYDSYGRSTYLYKEKDTDGGKLKIGPPWDYDRSMNYNDINTAQGWVWEITHPYWPFPFWWSKMYTDTIYKKELACRWKSLRTDEFQTSEFMNFIDSVSLNLNQAQSRNFTVWNDLGSSTFANETQLLKNYLSARLTWIDNELFPYSNYVIPLEIPMDTSACIQLDYDAALSNGLDLSYNWKPGPDSSFIHIQSTGTYHLEVTDNFGCQRLDTMQVDIYQNSDTSIQINVLESFIFNDQEYDHTGIYEQHFQNIHGCDSLITIQLLVVTNGKELLVFPNPSSNGFSIQIPSSYVGNTFQIYDALGKILFNGTLIQEKTDFFWREMASGIYFLKIDNLEFPAKIIKE